MRNVDSLTETTTPYQNIKLAFLQTITKQARLAEATMAIRIRLWMIRCLHRISLLF
jgi:hypothetical protein